MQLRALAEGESRGIHVESRAPAYKFSAPRSYERSLSPSVLTYLYLLFEKLSPSRRYAFDLMLSVSLSFELLFASYFTPHAHA